MSKKIGFISIIALGINLILGGSIFILPTFTYQLLGPYLFLPMIFCAVISILVGLCFSEMSSKYTRSGSVYIYAKENFGLFVGFEVGFIKYLTSVLGWAAKSNALAPILSSINPIYMTPLVSHSIAIASIVIFSIINLMGIKVSEFMNNLFTLGKIIPLAFFALTGVFFIHLSSFQAPATLHIKPHDITTGCLLFFACFTGFEAIAVASQEMKDPDKNLPKAIFLVITSVAFIYFVIFFVCIGILGPKLGHEYNSIATAISSYMGPVGFTIVFFGSLASIIGINIGSSFETPRSFAPLAEDYFIPHKIGEIDKRGVPRNAILITMIITSLVSLSGNFVVLVQLVVILRFLQYIPTCLAVLKSRKDNIKGGFMVPWARFIVPLVILSMTFFILSEELYHLLFNILLLLLGAFIYFAYSKKRRAKYLESSENQ